ncbi:MAG: HNH endonuclease [Terriglobales bacterium]
MRPVAPDALLTKPGVRRDEVGSMRICTKCGMDISGKRDAHDCKRDHAERSRAMQEARSKRFAQTSKQKASRRAVIWGKNHQADRRVAARNWRSKNRVHLRSYYKQDYKRYRSYRLMIARVAKHSRRVKLGGVLTVAIIEAVFAAYSSLCVYCGAPATAIDHFVPVARGGTNDRDNLVTACKSCNSRKGAKDPIEWMLSNGISFAPTRKAASS